MEDLSLDDCFGSSVGSTSLTKAMSADRGHSGFYPASQFSSLNTAVSLNQEPPVSQALPAFSSSAALGGAAWGSDFGFQDDVLNASGGGDICPFSDYPVINHAGLSDFGDLARVAARPSQPRSPATNSSLNSSIASSIASDTMIPEALASLKELESGGVNLGNLSDSPVDTPSLVESTTAAASFDVSPVSTPGFGTGNFISFAGLPATTPSCASPSQLANTGTMSLGSLTSLASPVVSKEKAGGRTPKAKHSPVSKPDEYKCTAEYLEKRARNNAAVRKSRIKAKRKSKETEEEVVDLRTENQELKQSLINLQSQLQTLRTLQPDLFDDESLELRLPGMSLDSQTDLRNIQVT